MLVPRGPSGTLGCALELPQDATAKSPSDTILRITTVLILPDVATKRTDETSTLFSHAMSSGKLPGKPPLADRMRPTTIEEYVGQGHLLGQGRFLLQAIRDDRVPSMILWGPPGSGKTSLGRVIAGQTKAELVQFSAVLGSLAELRQIVEEARRRRGERGQRTIVFVDEIHRFNKAQQDAFLPHVEGGTIVLVGATTENPSFAVNAALLSRCKVFRLEPLADDALVAVMKRALDREHAAAADEALAAIAKDARGDARRALTTLEMVLEHAHGKAIDLALVEDAHTHAPLLYDKAGEEHYNVVSAFIKSMRGSDADAAIYWMMRMLEAGDDPLFVARRMIIFASEDIGNADANALVVANAADAAFRRLGMPEGIYPLAHAALYLASAPKSNAVKNAWQAAKAAIDEHGALPVPMKLRNAPTKLMKDEGYGKGYKYPHDYEDNVAPGETYLPDVLAGTKFYDE
jgi:putative ATPase